MAAILFRTPTQVNAKNLLREVHAAEEGVEAGVMYPPLEDSHHSITTLSLSGGPAHFWMYKVPMTCG
jgi:hypothetical protein